MTLDHMLLGAIAMACFTIALFFLHFWRRTRDRFFIFFALAFAAEGVTRVLLGLSGFNNEQEPFIYLIRLFGYLLLIYAIVDKNWVRKRP